MAATAGPRRSDGLRDAQGWHTEAQANFDRALGHALLETGALATQAYADAVTEQFVAGGALGLVLWELGLVDPELLTRTGASVCRLPAVQRRDVENGAAALGRLLPDVWLVEAGCMPFRRDARRLHVATCWPWRIDRLDELRTRTGLDAALYYLADVELMRALARIYAAAVPRRYLAHAAALGAAPGRVDAEDAAGAATETFELTTEAEFLQLYASPAGGAREGAAESSADADADDPETELLLEPSWEVATAQPGPAAASASPPPGDVPAAPPVQRTIETREQALALLDQAWDRHVIGDVLVRFGRSRAGRVVLFSCRKNVWLGWTGSGSGVHAARIAELMVPTVPGTVFGLVAASAAPYLGPLPEHPVHRSFLAALGHRQPASIGLFPVRHRGRLLLVLYVDGGHRKLVSPDVSDLLIVAQRLPAALERIVAARS